MNERTTCEYCTHLEYYNTYGDIEYFCKLHGKMVNDLEGCSDKIERSDKDQRKKNLRDAWESLRGCFK